jgi:hypothetical protein
MSPTLQASNPIYDSNPLFVLGLTIS